MWKQCSIDLKKKTKQYKMTACTRCDNLFYTTILIGSVCVCVCVYRRWLFFQDTVWKRVEMMKSELRPAP